MNAVALDISPPPPASTSASTPASTSTPTQLTASPPPPTPSPAPTSSSTPAPTSTSTQLTASTSTSTPSPSPSSTSTPAPSPSSTSTHSFATSPQLRALHALARKRGLDHDALRAAAGVPSLKMLTIEQAGKLIDQWQQQRPNGCGMGFRPSSPPSCGMGFQPVSPCGMGFQPVSGSAGFQPKRRSRLQPGVIRPMTRGQFWFMADRFAELNWKPDRIVHWLAKRYQVKAECPATAEGGYILRITSAVDSRLARQINDALYSACKKRGRTEAVAHPPMEGSHRAPF